MICPHEKCGHAAEDHGAFTCWKGCGCGFGKWDLDPWGEDERDKPAPKPEAEAARLRRRVETLEGRLARVLDIVAERERECSCQDRTRVMGYTLRFDLGPKRSGRVWSGRRAGKGTR